MAGSLYGPAITYRPIAAARDGFSVIGRRLDEGIFNAVIKHASVSLNVNLPRMQQRPIYI